MTLQDATRVFVAGWSTTRLLHGPFEVQPRGPVSWMFDPRGKRMGELIGAELAPEALVAQYPVGERGAIGAIYASEEGLNEHKRRFRALGWRLLRTEPMFVHHLGNLPPEDPRIVRARTPEHVAQICRAAKMRPEGMGAADEDDAPIRLYEARFQGEHAGWVASVRVGDDAWVRSLNVRDAFRRQGLGSGLMAALLHDDARLGRRASVLLASHTGALLYPKLGYERIGTLMLLMPIKGKSA